MVKSKETTKKLASRNIRFMRAAFSIVKIIRITLCSCKYSKKVYTQYQLLTLIHFRDHRNQHYREFIEDIEDMESVQGNWIFWLYLILQPFRNFSAG
ncbi:MAG: hypothetical protein METHP_01750 [Methanoregula sp. SKADARSKE-2]|nr:MAG: hypothetical protein METHP_01750 [Methanoregula sp. SKADARSKE-2]